MAAERAARAQALAAVLDAARRQLREALETVQEERRIVETLHRIGSILAAELDLQRLLQRVTDEATALTGAAFGAFFYNAVDEKGARYLLYALSGAPREAFAGFPAPRDTPLFAPIFRGEGIIRLDDVTRDPRYGCTPPYHGMPPGHLPVRSYLAVPVVSRSGEVLGGLFFGHPEPGRFTEEHERLVAGVAAQAAVAIDNARLYEKAQQAIRMREDFLSVASHELRTPLTPLQLAVQGLLRDLERDPPVPRPALAAKAAILNRQIARLNTLVETLLDLSRLSAGRLELTLEEIDLGALVHEVAGRFQAELERAGVSLAVEVEGAVTGTWDRMRLEQIVGNLLSNAVKYGSGRPVVVRVGATGDTATLAVQDQGIGIPPEDQGRIFERFERVAPDRRQSGFGLGLWIARRLTEALGGRISVRSAPGEGSTFTVELPRPGPGRAPAGPAAGQGAEG